MLQSQMKPLWNNDKQIQIHPQPNIQTQFQKCSRKLAQSHPKKHHLLVLSSNVCFPSVVSKSGLWKSHSRATGEGSAADGIGSFFIQFVPLFEKLQFTFFAEDISF